MTIPVAKRTEITPLICPEGHRLVGKTTTQDTPCSVCARVVEEDRDLGICTKCNFVACSTCINGPGQRKLSKCVRQGCVCHSFNGEPGNHCSTQCRDGTPCTQPVHVLPSVPPKCVNPACNCHAYSGNPKNFCSRECGQGKPCAVRTHVIPIIPCGFDRIDVSSPARCVRDGCPCFSMTGMHGGYCSPTCEQGRICNYFSHPYPAKRCKTPGCPCFAPGGRYDSCCGVCSKGTPCKYPYHDRPDRAMCYKPPREVYDKVCKLFLDTWAKGEKPSITQVIGLHSPGWILHRFNQTAKRLQCIRGDSNIQLLFHGTVLGRHCTLQKAHYVCSGTDCGVCGLTRTGFDPARIGKSKLSQNYKPGSGFRRFGSGFYFAENSSKAHDYAAVSSYSVGNDMRRSAVLIFELAMGKEAKLGHDAEDLVEPPPGCDSVKGVTKAESGNSKLNFAEVCVYQEDLIRPLCAIYYNYHSPDK